MTGKYPGSFLYVALSVYRGNTIGRYSSNV